MKIAIVIPTYKRPKKLLRCINSIGNQTHKNFELHIFFDNNDYQSCEEIFPKRYGLLIGTSQNSIDYQVYLNEGHLFAPGSWNRFASDRYHSDNGWDGMLWLVDDAELYPDCLEKLDIAMTSMYPDFDGVIGTSQECPNHPEYTYKPYGQVLIGKKFIDRYKAVGYKICCPSYNFLYQDEELYLFASSLGKFYHCKDAIIKHYHPAFVKEEIDETHKLSRIKIKEDQETYNRRRNLGLIWGNSWQV